MTPDVIVIDITGLGQYRVTPEAMDIALERYLPDSVGNLREQIIKRSEDQGGGIDYSVLRTLTECLVVLAQYDGYGI